MKKNSYAYFAAGCLAAGLVLTALVAEWYPLEALEYKLYDLRMDLRQKPVSSPVVIVNADQAALKQGGTLPRAYIGLLVSRLHEYRAKVIGIDMLLDEKEPNPGLEEIRGLISKVKSRSDRIGKEMQNRLEIRNEEAARILNSYKNETDSLLYSLEQAEKMLDGDMVLASSIAEAGNVVLPVLLKEGQANNHQSGLDEYAKKSSLPPGVGNAAMSARSAVEPLNDFAGPARAVGHITRMADKDDVVRSEPLLVSYDGRLFPSFALQLIIHYLDSHITEARTDKSSFKIKNISLPTYKGRLLVNFSGQNTPPSYPLSEIISGQTPSEAFRDKIVLLGSASGPFLRTPAGSSVQDTGFIANVIGVVLGRHYITRPAWALLLESAIIVFSAAVLVFSISRFRPGISAAVASVLLILWSAAAVYLFVSYGYWLKVSYQMALTGIGFCAMAYSSISVSKGAKEHSPDTHIIKGAGLSLTVGAQTDIGLVRQKNEDNFCVAHNIPLLAVADGVGGQAAGEVASRMAVDIISGYLGDPEIANKRNGHYVYDYSETTNRLGDSVRAANKAIYEAPGNALPRKMGTTIAAAMLKGNRLSLAHVGDSRIYLVRSRNIEQLTDDHNLCESGMKHVLTQALGSGPDVDVELGELTLASGDIVILCSDGLNTMVSDDDILSAVLAGNDPNVACKRLVSLANKRGGKDNITVIVAYAR